MPAEYPEPGTSAPDFTAQTQDGKTVSLADLKGKQFVLYFYPRDSTPGCTKEACAFQENLAQFNDLNVPIYGVSKDSAESHNKFRDKYDLQFDLLVDTEGKICEDYGVWQEKNMYGKKSWGIVRTTFIIDAEGKIKKVFKRVKVDGHVDAVLEALG